MNRKRLKTLFARIEAYSEQLRQGHHDPKTVPDTFFPTMNSLPKLQSDARIREDISKLVKGKQAAGEIANKLAERIEAFVVEQKKLHRLA